MFKAVAFFVLALDVLLSLLVGFLLTRDRIGALILINFTSIDSHYILAGYKGGAFCSILYSP